MTLPRASGWLAQALATAGADAVSVMDAGSIVDIVYTPRLNQ